MVVLLLSVSRRFTFSIQYPVSDILHQASSIRHVFQQNVCFSRQTVTFNLQKAAAEFIQMLIEILVFNAIKHLLLYIISNHVNENL
jgi:hypothetical protein